MYVGRKYTATVEGSVWRPVTCECCSLQWAYKLTRKAEGTGRSAYFLDNEGASQRASAEARQLLQRQLEKDVDAIACPQCLHYQKNMLGEARFNAFGHWYGIAMFAGIAGIIFCGFWGKAKFSHNWVTLPGSMFFISALAMTLYGVVRSKLYQPNSEAAVQARAEKQAEVKTPVLLRVQYEASVARALAEGRSRNELAQIQWAA